MTVLGLAREGIALARFLVERGAIVTASDLKGPEEMRTALDSLRDLPVRLRLGGHPPELLDCDVMFVSPGVPLDAPILVAARSSGLLLSSESRLFCRLCPAPVVGITGSSGKTTTASLAAKMLEESGRRVHLGGNIGSPLIGTLTDIQSTDAAVVELSSFQLDYFGPVLDANPRGDLVAPLFPEGGWSPPLALVLNVTPNHLDRHPAMEDYVNAKSKIVRYQRSKDCAVLNWDDPTSRGLAEYCPGEVRFFSLQHRVGQGACLREGSLVLRRSHLDVEICSLAEVRLRGMHNVANVLAACAVCDALGAAPEHMASVARSFAGVEHRLEPVREVRGTWYYNDSIATSPERAMAALRSFKEPIVLLAGGRDKHLPWDEWAELVSGKVTHVVAFGEAAALVKRELSRLGHRAPPVTRVDTVAQAVRQAQSVARPGDVVLFSPGGTSFDAFRDFCERGQAFKKLVRGLDGGISGEQGPAQRGQT